MNHGNVQAAADGESLAQQLGFMGQFLGTINLLSGASGGEGTTDDKDVIVLTDATFDEAVYKSKDIWMVEFYAPWCNHC